MNFEIAHNYIIIHVVQSVEAFVANLELFLEEKDMKHVVDWTRGY